MIKNILKSIIALFLAGIMFIGVHINDNNNQELSLQNLIMLSQAQGESGGGGGGGGGVGSYSSLMKYAGGGMDRSGNVGFSGSYPRNSSSGGGGINHDTFGPNYYGVGGTSRPQAFDNVDTTTDGQCFRWCGDQCPGRCTIEYMVFGQSFTAQCNFTPVRY